MLPPNIRTSNSAGLSPSLRKRSRMAGMTSSAYLGSGGVGQGVKRGAHGDPVLRGDHLSVDLGGELHHRPVFAMVDDDKQLLAGRKVVGRGKLTHGPAPPRKPWLAMPAEGWLARSQGQSCR